MWRSMPDAAARTRLVNLVNSGALAAASPAAYQQGLGSLIRVGRSAPPSWSGSASWTGPTGRTASE
jgi:hypothetical protein